MYPGSEVGLEKNEPRKSITESSLGGGGWTQTTAATAKQIPET